MGKFVLIDFKKREDQKTLNKMVPDVGYKMDKWIAYYDCGDATPPNEDESKALEDAKIKELLDEFDKEAGGLWRVKDEVPGKRKQVVKNLDKRKGRLYRKYSDQVSALKNQAADTMQYCADTLADFEENLTSEVLPTSEADLEKAFADFLASIEDYINNTFPDGLSGMDSYDDVLPEGLPSYAKFKEGVTAKIDDYKAKNKDAIPGAVESVKASSKDMFKDVINKAVEKAIEDIVADLSDDTLPYLEEDAMQALRDELIAAAKEYGATRIES